jgi:hypothetical protein
MTRLTTITLVAMIATARRRTRLPAEYRLACIWLRGYALARTRRGYWKTGHSSQATRFG